MNAYNNIFWHSGETTKEDRLNLLNQKNKVLWFTGLSGSGKSTVARKLETQLYKEGSLCYVLDGDNIRHGLNRDLDFSPKGRKENIRRIREVTKLLYDLGAYVLVCFISPYREDRNKVRKEIGNDFIEVFVECPIEECEKRDIKGLYKKAKKGYIKNFTGINAPYEEPESPEIIINTKQETLDESVKKILKYIRKN